MPPLSFPSVASGAAPNLLFHFSFSGSLLPLASVLRARRRRHAGGVQEVYSGMVIGENSRPGDMEVNKNGLFSPKIWSPACLVASLRPSGVIVMRRSPQPHDCLSWTPHLLRLLGGLYITFPTCVFWPSAPFSLTALLVLLFVLFSVSFPLLTDR